jgi:uncharacterized protein (DUF1800 family)
MKLPRRSFSLSLAALPLLGTRAARASSSPAIALHALNRLGYGPRAGELARWGVLDWPALVEQQLNPTSLTLPAELQSRLDALQARQRPLADSVRAYREAERKANAEKDEKGAENMRRELVQTHVLDAAEARLLRALESPRQLEERLVEFWFNHFNVFLGKGPLRVMVGDYEARAIRPYVLGRFRDLLGATAKHPAMLFYLDNWMSSGPASMADARRPRAMANRPQGLNENYARELMELHTLGVDGGYTQRDVTELARVLTGWGIDRRGSGGFAFDETRHDSGSKEWLGQSVPGRGQRQGEWALDQLARHPKTAQRMAFKLAQHFVADQPDPQLVAATAQTFLQSDGDLLHPAARSEAVQGAQFKSPYRFVLSLLRATGYTPDNAEAWQPVLQGLRGLGQPLFGCVTPDGYKTTRDAWLDPEALTRRAELASRLAQRLQPAPDALLATLSVAIGPATRATVAQQPARQQAALLLGSPDFQNT